MMNIYYKALELIEGGQAFAFATIISEDGSTPRSAGSKMLITENAIYYTIGGGGSEGDVIRLAREHVLKDKKPLIKTYSLRGTAAADSPFICGGEIEVLIDYIDPKDPNNGVVFHAAAEATADGSTAWLVTQLDANDGAKYPRQFCLSNAKKGIIGDFEGTGFASDILVSPLRTSIHGETKDGVRFILDPVHTGGSLYIFGGGHVSLAVADIARMLEFHIVVIDDRAEFANKERFPFCETVVLPEFEGMERFDIDENSYILIVTRGHAFDRTVLEWALKTDACYIGMIGSRTKRDTIYSSLRNQGVAQERIDFVHSPVGIKIGAQTPEEIAVSITAELIEERAKKLK
ncbi:MAG: XdhC family aldehyde oxidoreductase maturation factor [Oscillospiraceae bacterium]